MIGCVEDGECVILYAVVTVCRHNVDRGVSVYIYVSVGVSV